MAENKRISKREIINIGRAINSGTFLHLMNLGRSESEIKTELGLSGTGFAAVKRHYGGWR